MGKVKRLELWWQLYVTWPPVRDSENFRTLDFVEQRLPLLQRRITKDGKNVEEILSFETDIMVKISTFSCVWGFITIFTTDRTIPKSVQSSVPVVVFYVKDLELLADRQEETEADNPCCIVSFVHHKSYEILAWFNSCSAVRVRRKPPVVRWITWRGICRSNILG